MRRERSKKGTDGGWGEDGERGGNGKRTTLQTLSLGRRHRVAPVGVENPNQDVRLQNGREQEGRGWGVEEGEGEGESRGERWRENVQIFSLK